MARRAPSPRAAAGPRRHWALAGGGPLACGLALSSGVSCGEADAHTFGAYRYNPFEDCMEGAAAVDVIEGPDPGICEEVRCWKSPGGEVYVTSTSCDAPVGYEEGTFDPAGSVCARALAAFALGDEGRCPAPEE